MSAKYSGNIGLFQYLLTNLEPNDSLRTNVSHLCKTGISFKCNHHKQLLPKI